VPWLRQLVDSMSLQRPGLHPRLVIVGFVVDRVAVGQVFLLVLWFSHVGIIPAIFHIHLYFTDAV
jgi:hypothetical protein